MSARPMGGLALADPFLGPQRLGKYEITGVLGEGAMGIVYKAVDPHIGRTVAIKAIRAPLLAPSAQEFGAEQRFRTEAQAAGRLLHPNIVSVHEFGEDGPDRFLVMEYVEGVSLLELTAHGRRLPLDDVASVMLQLLDALDAAHAQGVWHRDVKPANLLVTAAGRLKVTDFGIARIESAALTHHTTILGSPGYMAPERYTDDAPDSRVDIFACGVLLYELLTGQPPFRGTSSAVMYQVLHEEPPPPSMLAIALPPPARLDPVVARAIAKRPGDRFASAAQMRDALRDAMGRPIAPSVSVDTMVRPRGDAADAVTQVLPRAAVVATTGRPPGWDPALLAAIERLLTEPLGPVAPLVVRAAARRQHEPHALVVRLAAEHLEPGEREAFVAAAMRLLPPRTGGHGVHGPVATKALPVLGSTPMQPGLVEQAERVLRDHIGPIAGLIVRRAAAAATSREQFYTALADGADGAGDEADRRALLDELWKLG